MPGQLNNGVVLYVEDEESDAFFMQRAFKRAGLDCVLHIVSDGREAIDYLSGKGTYTDRGQHPIPTVVLLDLNLPLISGFKVLEWMRSQPDFRSLPVVIFSSSSDPEDRSKALKRGANELVEKPRSGILFVNVVKGLQEKFLTNQR